MASSIPASASSEPTFTDSNREYNLILLKGRGTKRKFNDKHARLVTPKVNKGGWVSVRVKGEEECIPWRNKAWKVRETENSSISFSDLPDVCLVNIFSFLGAGEHVAPTSDEELAQDFSDEELEQLRGRSVDYVDVKFSLEQALKLHKTIALLSKDSTNCAVALWLLFLAILMRISF